MPKLAVVNGAIIKCAAGAAPSPLTVTTPLTPAVNGAPTATVLDNQPIVNIKPFGFCTITGGPCVPITPIPWVPGEASIASSQFPVLPADSILPCMVGGIIRVINPGQGFFFVDSLTRGEALAQGAGAALSMLFSLGRGEVPAQGDDEAFWRRLNSTDAWSIAMGELGGLAKLAENWLRRQAVSYRRRMNAAAKAERSRRAVEERRKKSRAYQKKAGRARIGGLLSGISGAIPEIIGAARDAAGGNYPRAAGRLGGLGGSGLCMLVASRGGPVGYTVGAPFCNEFGNRVAGGTERLARDPSKFAARVIDRGGGGYSRYNQTRGLEILNPVSWAEELLSG